METLYDLLNGPMCKEGGTDKTHTFIHNSFIPADCRNLVLQT